MLRINTETTLILMCVVHLSKTSLQNKFCCDNYLKKYVRIASRNVGRPAFKVSIILFY